MDRGPDTLCLPFLGVALTTVIPGGKAEMLNTRTQAVLLKLACLERGRLAELGPETDPHGPGNAPSRSSEHGGGRTGRNGHRLPRHGCGPHAPGPPRSPPGDDRFPQPPSPGRSSGTRAAPTQSQAGAAGDAPRCHRLRAPVGEHQRTGSALQCPHLFENLQGMSTQRHPVTAVRLRPPSRNGPHPPATINLPPLGPPHLSPARCRQNQELKGQPSRQCTRCPRLPDHFSRLPMGHGLHVLGHVLLGTKDRTDPVAGVVGPVLHGHAPFQDRAQPLAHVLGGGYLRCQRGVRISSRSALVTSETGILPMHERLTPAMMACGFADVQDCKPAVFRKILCIENPVHPVHRCELIFCPCSTVNQFPAARRSRWFQAMAMTTGTVSA